MSNILIVGATRGIGLELTKQYAEEGNSVIACARDKSNASLLDELASGSENISIEELEQYLLPKPPKVSTVLSALTEINMEKSNKLRWVEKSPEHLREVNMIRSYFPASPIVRILRDPRDVALSIQKPPWGPKNDIDAFLLWREYDDRSWDFFHNDLNCFSIYYHDLICDPICFVLHFII